MSELKNKGISVALIISLTTIILGLTSSFSTVNAQRATPELVVERTTPVPPTPVPIAIVIEESVSVGETSVNGGLDPITEAIAIEDSISNIDPLNETITVGDQTDVELGKSPVNQQTKSSDRNQGADEREKKSRDAFSRATGSVKESGEGSDNGSLGAAGNAGSAWMVVVYVVIGLAAVALLGLFGRRLRRRMQD